MHYETHIRYTVYYRAFEFTTIEFLNCGFEVGTCLELDEAGESATQWGSVQRRRTLCCHCGWFPSIPHPIDRCSWRSLSNPFHGIRYSPCIDALDAAHLPACVGLQASNGHAVDSPPRSWGLTFLRSKVILSTWATGELNSQSFSLEFRSICEKW